MNQFKKITEKKHQRILSGGVPRTLDLFAGCGGFSLGFEMAGFQTIGAVEHDREASRSHALNFMSHLEVDLFEIHARSKDIIALEPEELMSMLGYSGKAEDQVDVIIGGPPCQAFARVGRAKLREVASHPEAFLKDPRGNLYLRYLDYVRRLKPIAIVMENVPDVLNYGGHNIAEETCEILDSWGYRCGYTLLNSVFYGVPQMRERMFLVAIAKPIGTSINFPHPTHWFDLPKGYADARKMALQTVSTRDKSFFIPAVPASKEHLKPATTAKDALNDLPLLKEHLTEGLPKYPKRTVSLLSYRKVIPTSYAKIMREWRSEISNQVADHVIRNQPRDFPIFKCMKPGDEYPQAHAIAQQLFQEKLSAYASAHGKQPHKSSSIYKEIQKATVPPYDFTKFPNKWRKMEPDAPARTLMAHLGKDCYSHIHYDSNQARTISIREAARLQSFPDRFQFFGSMGAAFRQIGNAVPPLVAMNIAQCLLAELVSG